MNDEHTLTISAHCFFITQLSIYNSCRHRYNNDGYSEHENGDRFGGTGIGRAWPLLTGERAHYEVVAGNLEGAKELLKTIEAFTNNGLHSEHRRYTSDKGLFFDRQSGSALPHTRVHAAYIKL